MRPGQSSETTPGWTFCTVVLEEDLVMAPGEGGHVHITQGALGNTCGRVGGEHSNYTP
jgi:hypothetical protein